MKMELFTIEGKLLGELIFHHESFSMKFFMLSIRHQSEEIKIVIRHIPPFNCRQIANDGRSTRRY